MKRIALGISLFILAAVAVAATIHASWTMPTTNTDGSAIPATGAGSIVSSTVEYGPCNAARDAIASVTGSVVVPGTATVYDTPNLGPGIWCARVRVTNTYGSASAFTPVGVKVIDAPTPNAPTNFTFG